MKLETGLPPRWNNLAEVAATASSLEQYGFDGVFSFEGSHDAFLPLACAAGSTHKVGLGTAVAVAFARNPMLCAQMSNDVHWTSGGRHTLGLGAQTQVHIEQRFGEPWSKPVARMREYISVIRAIWDCWNKGSDLDFHGEFYSHTLMTPLFNPGPNPYGAPEIFVGAVGPKMIEMAAEVCDGLYVSPFNTAAYVTEKVLPCLEKGFANTGKNPNAFTVSCHTITMLGSNDKQIEAARAKGRAQVAEHLMLPDYSSMIEFLGWQDVVAEAGLLLEKNQGQDATSLVSDDMLNLVGVSGTPSQIATQLKSRNSFAGRTALGIYNESEPDALADLVRAIKAK